MIFLFKKYILTGPFFLAELRCDLCHTLTFLTITWTNLRSERFVLWGLKTLSTLVAPVGVVAALDPQQSAPRLLLMNSITSPDVVLHTGNQDPLHAASNASKAPQLDFFCLWLILFPINHSMKPFWKMLKIRRSFLIFVSFIKLSPFSHTVFVFTLVVVFPFGFEWLWKWGVSPWMWVHPCHPITTSSLEAHSLSPAARRDSLTDQLPWVCLPCGKLLDVTGLVFVLSF